MEDASSWFIHSIRPRWESRTRQDTHNCQNNTQEHTHIGMSQLISEVVRGGRPLGPAGAEDSSKCHQSLDPMTTTSEMLACDTVSVKSPRRCVRIFGKESSVRRSCK